MTKLEVLKFLNSSKAYLVEFMGLENSKYTVFDISYWIVVIFFFVSFLAILTILEIGRSKHKHFKGLRCIYIIGGVLSRPVRQKQ